MIRWCCFQRQIEYELRRYSLCEFNNHEPPSYHAISMPGPRHLLHLSIKFNFNVTFVEDDKLESWELFTDSKERKRIKRNEKLVFEIRFCFSCLNEFFNEFSTRIICFVRPESVDRSGISNRKPPSCERKVFQGCISGVCVEFNSGTIELLSERGNEWRNIVTVHPNKLGQRWYQCRPVVVT